MVALIFDSAGLRLRTDDPVANISHPFVRSLDGSEHQPQQVSYRLVLPAFMGVDYWRDRNKELKWL